MKRKTSLILLGVVSTALLWVGALQIARAYTPDNHERGVREAARMCRADHGVTIADADLKGILKGVVEPDKWSSGMLQIVAQRFEPGAYGSQREISADRIAAQSFHATPNPTRPVYTDSEGDQVRKQATIPRPAAELLPNRLALDVYSYNTNQDVRNRMLVNASQLLCVSLAHRDDAQSTRRFGNMLHMIGDTYSASHVQRSEPEGSPDNCGTEKIEWHFSMDLVSWELHRPADKNNEDWRFDCLVKHSSDLMKLWADGRAAVREESEAIARLERANETVDRSIRLLCNNVLREDPEVLGRPAGGASIDYSIASGMRKQGEDRPIQPVGLTGPAEAEAFVNRIDDKLQQKGEGAHFWYPSRDLGDLCEGLDSGGGLPDELQCSPQEIEWAMNGNEAVDPFWIPVRSAFAPSSTGGDEQVAVVARDPSFIRVQASGFKTKSVRDLFYRVRFAGSDLGDRKPLPYGPFEIPTEQTGIYTLTIVSQKMNAQDDDTEKVLWEQDLFAVRYSEKLGGRYQRARLAHRYAPVALFDREEEFYPSSIPYILNETSPDPELAEEIVQVRTGTLHWISMRYADLAEYVATHGETGSLVDTPRIRKILKAKVDEIAKTRLRYRTGSPEQATLYFSILEEPGTEKAYINYHFLYAYDPKTGSSDDPSKVGHVFDRESLTVILDTATLEAEAVVFGAHLPAQTMGYFGIDGDAIFKWEGGRVKIPWDSVDRLGDHPLAAVASGSHGIYPLPGRYAVLEAKVKILKETAGGNRILVAPDLVSSMDHLTDTTAIEFVPYDLADLELDEVTSLSWNRVLIFSGNLVDVPGSTNARFPPFTAREVDPAAYGRDAPLWPVADIPQAARGHQELLMALMATPRYPEHMESYGGTYSLDCSDPEADRVEVHADHLLWVTDGRKHFTTDIDTLGSYWGNSPPPENFSTALVGNGEFEKLVFVVSSDEERGLYIDPSGGSVRGPEETLLFQCR